MDEPTQQTDLAAVRYSDETQTIIDQALVGATPHELDAGDLLHVIVPEGATSTILDLEKYLPVPRRARGVAQLDELQSLIAYVKRHDIEATTTLWVGFDSHCVIAVLNDDAGDAQAGWRDQRAELMLRHTPEWARWMALNDKLVPQGELAQHIEQSIPEIAKPDGADLLEVVETFYATTTVAFRSAVRVQNDTVTLMYDEQQDATAGQTGQMAIPRTFELAIAPFRGQGIELVTAKLRWSTRERKLRIGYSLERPDEILRLALDRVAEELNEQFAGRVFRGIPPVAR